MPHTEPSANYALGTLLQGMMPSHTVRSEHTGLIVDHPGQHADNLITGPGVAPIAVEAEFMPAGTVESDAAARLGLRVENEPYPIEAAIALRYPADLADADNLDTAISGARLSYALLNEDGSRFPEAGWLEGSVGDLADLVRLASVPQQAINRAADTLQQGIERAVVVLNQVAEQRPAMSRAIARLLGMDDLEQTRRMACAIIANAMVFHERLAGMHGSVKSLRLVCGPDVLNPQNEVLNAWKEILNINYWAIFAVARDILTQLSAGPAARLLAPLCDTAQNIDATGVNNAHDLTGRIFQRLISDRKYLATFYTRPASAALLAHLAVARVESVDWSNPDAIAKLRVGDFACGTGALLSAVYERIASRHEREGGSAAALHKPMMEDVLYGCDVMPSAVHITGATLSGVQPNVGFEMSRLYTLAYGRQDDGSVRIGSLELLQASSTMTLFNTSDPARRTGSLGEETAAQIVVDVPDRSFDLVIMNPPFTRAGSDWEGPERAEDYVKQFRGLSTDLETQKEMAKRLGRYAANTCYHGYAGIASAFAALADSKLKPGGVLALVLPLSVASGLSWQNFRRMLAKRYSGLAVLSIAANGNGISFSSDTGMGECLVVARKRNGDEPAAPRAHFVSLRQRPQGFVQAGAVAKAMIGHNGVRRIEDGPYGGDSLSVGDTLAGEMLDAPQPDGSSWGGVRIADYGLAQTAYSLSQSILWPLGTSVPVGLTVAPLHDLGERGWQHMNLIGARAPFTKLPPSQTATYPALWNHDAKQETRMVCNPDSELRVRPGQEAKASQAWTTASRIHLSLDFRFNSQPLAVAFTEQLSMGGTAWPNVSFEKHQYDYTFAIWGNSTLGLLSWWWHSSRQQDGRGRITIHAIETLPVLNLRTLSDAQLATAEAIFEDFRDREFQPAYLADADPNRALLDRRLLCEVLGFDESVYEAVRRLAAKWCAEPSVHGGKPRPANAGLVI